MNQNDIPESDQADPKLVQANKLYQTGVMLMFGKRKSVDRAIKCIQKAITLNDADYKYWQLLGEAYYQRGSLNPAINCFMRCLTLAEQSDLKANEATRKRVASDCTYSKLRMSDIRLAVAHSDQAVQGYSDIISLDPNNVAALIGLSKAELQIARNSFHSNLIMTGHLHCMKALKHALSAIKLKPGLCLTWKLASDCCLIQFLHGQRGDFTTQLDVDFPGCNCDGLVIDRFACIDMAQKFLSKAIAIESFGSSGCLWHNLGLSIYLKSTLVNDETQCNELLKRSLKCLIKALNCDRTNSQIRNTIGIVAYRLNYLNTAQNFLIKSIQTNMSTSEIQFSNLGYIYLIKGEYRLAGVAFTRCQAEEPLYFRSWLGTAILSEAKDIDNLLLLRHCHNLESNYESQIMYAAKVTSLPYRADYEKDIMNALECMRNTINIDRKSYQALNILGLLFERCKFFDQAREAFQEALSLRPNDSRIIFNRLRQHRAHSDCYNLNQLDVEDLDFIKKAEKLAHDGTNREYLLNFIYYMFNNRDYQKFNPLMTKLLDKMPQDDVKNKIGAQILLALKAKASNEDYKSWLFKNIIDSERVYCIEAVINLYCLLIFESISQDDDLVKQISADLCSYLISYISSRHISYHSLLRSNDGFWTLLVMLSSIFCLLDTSKIIRPLVVMFPDVAEHWFLYGLALMLERTHKRQTQYKSAIYCLKKAKMIESLNANILVVCDILLAILIRETRKTQSQDSRLSYLSRAVFRSPAENLLRQSLADLKKTRESPVKTNATIRFEDTKSHHGTESLLASLTEQEMSLFHLAIDKTIEMISLVG